MTTHSAPFPQLRYAYLRAIARAWNDKKYLKEIDDAGYDGLELLEKQYKFVFEWDVKFRMSAKKSRRPIWLPNQAGGWFGFGDYFEVALPNAPDDPKERAAVLGHYSQEFPSMLGKGRFKIDVTSPGEKGKKQVGLEAPPDFAEFGVVTGRLIALTWANRGFRKALFSARTTPRDSVTLVQNAMGYMFPWNFGIRFVPHDMPPSSKKTDEWNAYWTAFPKSKIKVYIPRDPRDSRGRPDYDVQPVALAAYNGTGDQYPFSC